MSIWFGDVAGIVWEVRIVNDAGKLACISRCTLAVIGGRSAYATAAERSRP